MCAPFPSLLTAQSTASSQSTSLTVGALVVVGPSYPGSEERRLRPVPTIQLIYRGRVAYLAPSAVKPDALAIGMHVVRSPHLTLGVELGAQARRPASRADALAGMDDRGITAAVATVLSYRVGPLEGLVGVAEGLTGRPGTLATTRLTVGYRVGPLTAGIGVGATFADARQMRSDFGITDGEASRRLRLISDGDPRLRPDDRGVYRPDAGMRSQNTAALVGLTLSTHWSAMAFAGLERLSHTAAESPLVRRRHQRSIGVGVRRRF
jgi:outer membrane scaffolding protein for murein synthesis (MipA/OmpV family)